jgi:endonuclease YncB( thermonuclease family)
MSPLEQVRETIRAELDKHRPIEVARGPLELIAESSLRYTGEDGSGRFRVVDAEGQPRTKVEDGRVVEFTIADLVRELVGKHPRLFRREEPETRPAPVPAPAAPEPSAGSERTVPPRGPEPARARGPDEPALPPAAPPPRLPRLPRLRSFEAPRPSVYLYAAVAGLMLFLGAAYVLPWGTGSGWDVPAESGTNVPLVQEPSTTGALPPPAAATAAAGANGPLTGIPEVLDTATLKLDGNVVRLFGVEWARGGDADDLRRYLAAREVACEPTDASDAYRCHVDGRDLSEVVLYNGGGRATADASPELRQAEAHARAERIGVWRR